MGPPATMPETAAGPAYYHQGIRLHRLSGGKNKPQFALPLPQWPPECGRRSQRKGPRMEQFRAVLEARDPARGRFRAYRIEAGTDLLGDWLVDVTYGRIGTRGRRIRPVAAEDAPARPI